MKETRVKSKKKSSLQRNLSFSVSCLFSLLITMVTIAKVMKIKSAIKGHIMGFALQWLGVVYSYASQ